MNSGTGAGNELTRRNGLELVLVLAAVALVYVRALSGELVYDDHLLIARNPLITDLGNLPRLFTSGYWDFLDVRDAQYIGYWRPLTAVVQALVWPFAGVKPGPYHLACLAIHLLATVAAYGLAWRLTRRTWIAGGTALLFGLHPAHVESVAWISALNDPLFGCLALFSIERFLAWRERGSPGLPLASAACFALALLAKELAAAIVPLIFVFDCTRPRAATDTGFAAPPGWPARLRAALESCLRPPAAARAYLPFALTFALYLAARMVVFASPWAGFERITTDFLVGAGRLALLRIEVFGGALEILTLPIELNVFRPFRPDLAPFDPPLLRASVYTALFAALLCVAFLGRRRVLLAALLVIPAGLGPALVKVQSLGLFPLSERFLYLPVFGFALAFAWGLERLSTRAWGYGALLTVASLYGVRSFERTGVWQNEEALFRNAVERSPRSVYVHWSLGRALLERLNSSAEPRYLTEAAATFERAAQLLEESKQSRTDLMVSSRDTLQVNLGLAWCSIYAEDYTAAIVVLEELARRIEEIHAGEREARAKGMRVREQFLDLEKVYTALGVAQGKAGSVDKAEASFQKALELQPSSPETRQNLGRLYAELGRWEEAAREFEACLALRPGEAEDRLLLAQALETLGQSERAEALARELLELLPDRVEPLVVLATAALRRNEPTAALSWLERALLLQPRHALAWYQKARALLLRGDAREAVSAFRAAVEIDPDGFEAHYDLGAFLLSQGLLAEAKPYLVRAYELAPPAHRPPLRAQLLQMPELEPATLQALVQRDTGRNEAVAALEWTERLVALAPEDVEVRRNQARILRHLGRPEEAVGVLRTLTERAPSDFELWAELGQLLHKEGRFAEAEPVLDHALTLPPPRGVPAELHARTLARLRDLLEEIRAEPPPGD